MKAYGTSKNGLLLPSLFFLFLYLTLSSPKKADSEDLWSSKIEQAQIYRNQGQYEKSLSLYLELSEHFQNPLYFKEQASLLGKLLRFNEQGLALEKYVQHSSLAEDACPELIQAFKKANNEDKITSSVDLCLKMLPDDTDLLVQNASLSRKSGKLQEAEALYKKALVSSPNSIDALVGLSLVSLRTGETQAAKEWANLAARRSPENFDVLLAKALVEIQQQNFKIAKQLLLKAKAQSPNNPDVLEALEVAKNPERKKTR
jgi:tetratricopeptide (TPR) repeat protein